MAATPYMRRIDEKCKKKTHRVDKWQKDKKAIMMIFSETMHRQQTADENENYAHRII